jgi:hypothetical protein
VSALQKNSSSKSTSKKSTSSESTGKDNGAKPKDAKGKTSVKAAAKFAGGLAIAAKGTPPEKPVKPVQPPKPKAKKTGVADAAVMNAPPATNAGANAAAPGPSATGGGAGAEKGPKSEASKSAKKVTGQKPSQILKAYKGMGKEVTAAKKKDEKKAHDGIPTFHAVMPGDAADKPKGKDLKPKSGTEVNDKVGGAEAKAPKLPAQKKGKATRQKVDGKSSAEMKRLAAIENAMDAIKGMFANITASLSTESNVNTDPGEAPEIVFSGQSNPQRADKAEANASDTINAGHEKFATAIDKGKQPSDVKRLEMDDVVDAVKNADLKIGEEQLQAGEKYYEKLVKQHTAQEIDNADGILDGDVQTKMAKSNKDMDAVLAKQEADRQASVESAKKDIDAKNQSAKAEQESIVAKSKKDIASAQKETRKKQDAEVKKAKRKGDKERRKVEGDIEDKEKKDEKKIVKEYDKAEKKAEAEEDKAEAKAKKKKAEAEKKKKEQSWWDRVKSAVSDFVDSVCSAIGDIFDALGSLVSSILNAVKDLACAVIDEAIKWAKKALDGLGSLLKGLVDNLIGDLFPELAKKLNDAIDSGIELAKKGCDVVGEKLKEGVTAAVDTVNAVVQKGLQVAKVGLQTAVRVTGCIATGDFEGAFLATFYGALEIAGVSKGDADKMLGDAKETLKLIVDKPGSFAGNLITAAKDGFVNFGKNFLGHFTGAVTDWLLGPVAAAGLKAPEKWDAQGIFGMVMGVLGVTGDSLKGMAADRIGEDNMAALEKAYEYVAGFIEGGFQGLWDQLKGDLSNIWDLVLGMITDYISKKVVQFGMEQLASLMAGPLGALWQALKTAWGIYCTVRDKINEIKEVLSAIFSSISDIARGNTTKASAWVEGALQKVLGIAIDLGANLAGIGDIPDKIRGFVEGLQERVKTAIGKAMDWVLEKVKGLFAGGKDEKKDDKAAAADDVAPEPPRTLPGDQPIAWQGGLINLTWSQTPSILLNVDGKYTGVSSKAIDDMIKDVEKTPDNKERGTALKQLRAAKGSAASVMSKAGKWIQDGTGSVEELGKQTGDIAALILDGLAPMDRLDDAADKKDPNQTAIHKVGEVIPFTAAGEKHRVFIDVAANDAQVMVASTPMPAAQHLANFKTKIGAASFTGDKVACEQWISQGKKLAGIADDEADAAVTSGASATAMVPEEKSLGDVMGKLFEATASTAEKEVKDLIVKKLDTPDREQLAVFIVQRDGGMSADQATKYSAKQLIEIGRNQWKGAFPTIPTFLLDVSKAIGDTIGTRKLGEFSKEHQKGAVGKLPEFYDKLWSVWQKNEVNGKNAIYAALQKAAGWTYTGLGDVVKMTKTLYRGYSAGKFYKDGVQKAEKDKVLNGLIRAGSMPVGSTYDEKDTTGPVFASWANKNNNERKIPAGEMVGSHAVSFAKTGWWSPDGRYLDVIDKTISGNDAFKQICKVGALAPEWYPEGLVQLHLDPGTTEFRRPTTFDGLMSPLWVQAGPDEVSATGGGAQEVLSQPVVKLGDCQAVYAHVTSADVAAALKKFNADAKAQNDALAADGKNREVHDPTNKYVETPGALPAGATPGEQQATDMQKTMAERTLEERDRAAGNTGEASNLLEHLQKNENTAHDIDATLAGALAKAPAPPGSTRIPKTFSQIFAARPTLKSLIHASSSEGKSLKSSLETLSVSAKVGGATVTRDFSGGYYPLVRKAMERELQGTVRDKTIIESVLRKKNPTLPASTQSALKAWLQKQDGASVAKDPAEEAKRKSFEKKLGKLAETHKKSMGTAKGMAMKAGVYIKEKATLEAPASQLDQKMRELMAACGGSIEQGWSGRFGNKTVAQIDKIKDVFTKGEGNIRELCNHVNNFCEQILGTDLLNGSTAEVEAMIAKADLGKKAVLKRRAEVDKELAVRRDASGRNVGAQVKGSKINDSDLGDETVANKGDTRITTNPNRDKEVENENWSKTKKSEAGDEVSLSSSEQGMGQYHVDKSGKVVLVVDDLLPWWEGASAWDINEENAWVQEARKLNMPLAGGVSGTTNRMMQNHALLKPGTPKADMRLTALGYLIPIKAHSFHEIMVSAKANGLPYTDGEYAPLEPLTGPELDAIGPVPDVPGTV